MKRFRSLGQKPIARLLALTRFSPGLQRRRRRGRTGRQLGLYVSVEDAEKLKALSARTDVPQSRLVATRVSMQVVRNVIMRL